MLQNKAKKKNKKEDRLTRDINDLVHMNYYEFHKDSLNAVRLTLPEIFRTFKRDFFLLMALAAIDRFVIPAFI